MQKLGCDSLVFLLTLPPLPVSSGRNKCESQSQLRNFGTAKSRARWIRPEVGGRKPGLPFGLFRRKNTKAAHRLQNYWLLPCHLTTHYSVDPTNSRNKATRRWESGVRLFSHTSIRRSYRGTHSGAKIRLSPPVALHCFWEGNKNGLLSNF